MATKKIKIPNKLKYNSENRSLAMQAGNETISSAIIPIRVAESSGGLELSSWSNASATQLRKMIEAADLGDIDLYEDAGWRVGDERWVQLGGMSDGNVSETQPSNNSMLMVLLDRGHFDLTYPVLNKDGSIRTKCSFAVGLKNCLPNPGFMNDEDTNIGGWAESKRRQWCNTTFRMALPSDIVTIFKHFKVVSASSFDSNDIVITDDYFTLPSVREIFGGDDAIVASPETTFGSTLGEWNNTSQLEWYTSSANQIKRFNEWGDTARYWERSIYYDNDHSYLRVHTNGYGLYYNKATYQFGISPFGVI